MSIGATEVLANRLRIRARQMRADWLRKRAMVRPFSAGASTRLLLVTMPERIPQSQIFPFHHFAANLRRAYDAEVREVDLSAVLSGAPIAATRATIVAFQTSYDVSDNDLARLADRLRADNPDARIACLDWFAPTDLRNAARMDPWINFYVKKHVLRDRSRYGQPTLGDTNLTDFYARRFDLAEPERRFAIPPGFLDKLVVGPSFATAPIIMPALTGDPPPVGPRPIDLHARFAIDGTDWYRAMRREAEAAVHRLDDLTVLRGGEVRLARFLAEMRKSKVCFSPFGYGEVCWRDYEAVMGGAVLLKPDMSHIETSPDIFIPWETYVPVAWDLSDFQDNLRRLIGDEPLRRRIAQQAFAVVHDWLTSDAFVRAMAPLFASTQSDATAPARA